MADTKDEKTGITKHVGPLGMTIMTEKDGQKVSPGAMMVETFESLAELAYDTVAAEFKDVTGPNRPSPSPGKSTSRHNLPGKGK